MPRAEGRRALQRRGRERIAQGRHPGPEPRRVSENEQLKGTSFPLSDEAQSKDFVLPLGKAHIEREGTDVTLVTFSKMVGYCLDAAEELAAQGISAEVLNLRSLRPLTDAIINSVKKTNRLVAVERLAAERASRRHLRGRHGERCVLSLDAPVASDRRRRVDGLRDLEVIALTASRGHRRRGFSYDGAGTYGVA